MNIYARHRYRNKVSAIKRKRIFLLLIVCLQPLDVLAGKAPVYDEVLLSFYVQGLGGTDLPSVIREEIAYLSVADVFSFLKIRNTPSPGFDSISGFFINQEAGYLIDRVHNQIVYQEKVYELNPGEIICTETNLYLKSNLFGEIFGLDCLFNFRSLSVTLNTKLELPVIREIRQEQMRTNLSRLKGEVKADTTIGRNYPFFHFGMADWCAIFTQQVNGESDERINLTLGSVIAGGEANVSINYNNNVPFTEKQQSYLWRFVNNNFRFLRQALVGKISTYSTSSIYDPVVGVQLSNTPSSYRRSFGYYTLSDVTEPGWIVELYVNNVLVDYVKADASGFYKFEVPLVYGNSAVMLRFYGPWGEEHTQEENISIPFNFLPPGEFEYQLSAGMVEDSLNSRFSRVSFGYGVNPSMTVGGGIEYLSSVSTGKMMPFAIASLRLGSNFIISGEYSYDVRYKGSLSARQLSDWMVELNYTKYKKGQKAIRNNYLEERKAVISRPVHIGNIAAYLRFTFNQIIFPNTKNTNAQLLFSGAVYGINTNFTTYALFPDPGSPLVYSNLSLAFSLPSKLTFTPQVQYEYNQHRLVTMKCKLEKKLLPQGALTFSYEQNLKSKISNIEIGLRYNLPSARVGLSARHGNKTTSLVQSASGSLIYDGGTNYKRGINRSSVGKGGITILPFVDMNGNKRWDPDEPKAFGLNLRVNGGRIEKNERDTTIRVFDLTPYTSYLVELNTNSFNNIAWQIENQTMNVPVSPNQFQTIEVPVAVMGEASGTVYFEEDGQRKGQGRILVCFYHSDSSLAGRTLTEYDGYFSFLGLLPGTYTARVDSAQLSKLHMTASPETIPITIKKTTEGDMVCDLEFTLRRDDTISIPLKK